MDWASRLSFLRSRNGLIAGAAVLVVTVSAVILYLNVSAKPQAATPSESPTPSATAAAPSVPEVGAQTVRKATTVEVLTVLTTNPTSGSADASANASIDIRFNLPVDPATAASYFSVLPNVPGTFSQGSTPQEIRFTPTDTFGLGSSVNVVLRKGYASRDGYELQNDYGFAFITALSPATVLFQVGDQLSRVHSAMSGHTVPVTLQFGTGVPATIDIETFRATSTDLLAAQVHDARGAYLDAPIDTSAMQSVATTAVVNGATYPVTQPDGIYLLLAADGAHQYGALWLDFSRFGVILRQDDQKVVLAGEDLTTGDTTPAFDVTFFNLQDRVQPLLSGTFSQTGEFGVSRATPIDVAIATSGDEEVVIPILAPQTGADIKVVNDLSTQPQIFLTTDRAGYQRGETVNFAGTVRLSNDQAYTVPTGMTVAVWSGYGESKPINETAAVADDGTFSGSFTMPDEAFNADGSDGQLWLSAGTLEQLAFNIGPASAQIATLGDHAPVATVTVSFDKTTYLVGETIVASLTGVDASGKPLAGKSVRLTVYSASLPSQPIGLDSFPVVNTWGVPAQDEATIALDGEGHATYPFKADVAQKAADQLVTLAATYGSGATAALGARTATVYQAADRIFLLPSRAAYAPGDTVIAPFVVETLAGERVANTPVAYEFDRTVYSDSDVTTTVVGSGTLITDANGLGTVRVTYSGPLGDVVLRVKGQDAAGHLFADAKPLTIADDPALLSWLGPTDALMQLSVTSDKIVYAPGDEAHLTVTSPTAQSVFMSLERGRIHRSSWISLAVGDNPLPVTISPDLAPGFTVTYSYFRDGAYVTEGLPIRIRNTDRMLQLTVTPDRTSYAAGQTAHTTISVTDGSGAPVAARLVVDAYDASMSVFKVVDAQSIAAAFFSPALRGTNGSSSLLGIGSWGGRCGGGGIGPQPALTNPGHTVLWIVDVTTDASGKATIDVPIPQGSVRLVVFASTPTTMLGQAQLDLDVP